MSENIITIDNLKVIYTSGKEQVHAVNGIHLRLEKGKTIGIVGETGAGKTTTALSIMRLLPEKTAHIKGGTIEFEGASILNLPESHMRKMRGEKIAMIFQDPMTSLNPVLTIEDQISEALTLHNEMGRSPSEITERVDEVLTLVGIDPIRKNDYPHQFSGGMKQRVVIAMALACEPDLLIADEPTTALDVTIQAQVLRLIKELKDRLNMSMIMITHDLGIVAQTCDTVAIMYAGKIIEYGSAWDIFKGKFHHPYTTGLFGSIPDMNGQSSRLKPISGLMPDPTNLPEGCAFSPRCEKCMDICKNTAPPEFVDNGHSIICHLFGKTGSAVESGIHTGVKL